MAKTFTYEDFEKALRDSGFSGQFSSADLALAKKNPDAGMSLLSYKQDYANATTDEMRALANAGAEEIRSSFGEYTAGKDGSGFYSTPLSPEAFEYGSAPSFTDNYAGDIEKMLADQMNRKPYSYSGTAPVYESKYGDTIDGLMSDILNRGEFSYDHTSDPLYSAYAKQYTREGRRATADALGEAASASGGMPSSYAVTAATQAGDYHAAQLADKIPELYQIAYDRYLNEYNMKLSDLNAAQGLEQFNHSIYQDQLGQYNRDREFDYAKWLDEYEMGQNNINTLRGLRDDDFSRYLAELEQYNIDRSFDYGQLLDEISSQTSERAEKRDAELTDYEKARNEEERAYQREQDAYDRAWNEEERAYQRAQDDRDYQLQLLKAEKAGGPSTDSGDAVDYNGLFAVPSGSESDYNDSLATLEGVVNTETSEETGGTKVGEYTARDLALNLYEGAAEIGVESWDDFESMLVENGVPEAEAEALTLEFRGIYGRDAFSGNKKHLVNGVEYIDRFDR